jgi:hypothetical protein
LNSRLGHQVVLQRRGGQRGDQLLVGLGDLLGRGARVDAAQPAAVEGVARRDVLHRLDVLDLDAQPIDAAGAADLALGLPATVVGQGDPDRPGADGLPDLE